MFLDGENMLEWIKIKTGLNQVIIITINVIIAIINPVTTYCINDVRTRNISRIIEGITAGVLTIYIILQFIEKTRMLNFIADVLISILQITNLIIVIVLANTLIYWECGSYLSTKYALLAITITLFSRVIEIIDYTISRKDNKILKIES